MPAFPLPPDMRKLLGKQPTTQSLEGSLGIPEPLNIPADWRSLAGALPTPKPEPLPTKKDIALDIALSTVGSVLAGEPKGIITGIQDVRNRIRETRQQNIAIEDAARKEKIDFLVEAIKQRRADEENKATETLEEAKREREIMGIETDKDRLAVEKLAHASQMDLDAARIERAEAALDRARATLEQKSDKSDEEKDEGRQLLAGYLGQLMSIQRQLAAQRGRGETAPVIRIRDDETEEVVEIAGKQAIIDQLERELQQATIFSEDPDVQEAMRSAFDEVLLPLLEQFPDAEAQAKAEAQNQVMSTLFGGMMGSEPTTARPKGGTGQKPRARGTRGEASIM